MTICLQQGRVIGKWMDQGFMYASVVKVILKTSSANYQLLKHLKMMADPLSPLCNRRLVKSKHQDRDFFPYTQTSSWPSSMQCRPMKHNKKQVCWQTSFLKILTPGYNIWSNTKVNVAVGINWFSIFHTSFLENETKVYRKDRRAVQHMQHPRHCSS